jgi:hypothetical protein
LLAAELGFSEAELERVAGNGFDVALKRASGEIPA